MSDPTRRKATDWPTVATLTGIMADRAIRTAEVRQADEDWTTEETVEQVHAAAVETADDIYRALLAATEMALDVWAAGR